MKQALRFNAMPAKELARCKREGNKQYLAWVNREKNLQPKHLDATDKHYFDTYFNTLRNK